MITNFATNSVHHNIEVRKYKSVVVVMNTYKYDVNFTFKELIIIEDISALSP